MKEIEQIRKNLNIALDRKYWVVIPLLLSILGGLYYALRTQPIFRGETLILVIAQKVPEGYVRSLVQLDMEERLRTIQQQVTSRTNLEGIMTAHELFTETGEARLSHEDKINRFRKRIKTNVVRDTAFSISFDYEDPKKAMDVTNKLASNFISENLKIREDHALGTSQFLEEELVAMRKRLEDREEIIKTYRQQHLGALPQDLATNLATLQRLQTRLDQLNTNLAAAEERRVIVQQQIAGLAMGGATTSQAYGAGDPRGLASLRSELANLELRYTENHPDVVRLKTMIARLESQEAAGASGGTEAETGTATVTSDGRFSLTDMLRPQLQQITSEIAGLRSEIQRTRQQMEIYEQRVEETPKREQEMILLTRDYETIKTQYDNMAKRKLDADIALNMERKQRGEQFMMLDPARLPERPVSPDVTRILMYSLILGLCLGGGLAFTVEMLDSSYKKPEEAEGELKLPVLGSLCYRYTKKELQMQKLKGLLKASSVAAGFAASALAIMIYSKGAGKTLDFIKNLLPWQM